MKFNFIFKWSNFSALLRGYPTFVISIAFIGANTAIIGDVAGHLGCFINLKDGVNAIAFVALGTSVPGKQPFPARLQKPYLQLFAKMQEEIKVPERKWISGS